MRLISMLLVSVGLGLVAVDQRCVVAQESLSTASSVPITIPVKSAAGKPLPPPGIAIEAPVRMQLETRLQQVRQSLESAVADSPDANQWRSDVDVLLRAVELALRQDLFYKTSEIDDAKRLLDEASKRIESARAGLRGLHLIGFDVQRNDRPQTLVGGFVSRIDDSVQPYGIVVPAGFQMETDAPASRLDVWLHGRGDTKTEIPFLIERMTKPGQYTPESTFVLHPFGRHCNAFKFAGETDVYESIEHLQKLVAIDSRRINLRGFSMGGAGCWHLAVHDPTRWMAVNPGAGFVDTIVYQGWTDATPFPMNETVEKLLRWYDVLPWVGNLAGTRTIAYSGEMDAQKQAADRVVRRGQELGIEFPHVIGAGMGHKIDAVSAQAIDDQIAAWSLEPAPRPRTEIDFVTYTLRYPRADWLRITGMEQQWTAAKIEARVDAEKELLTINTSGITHLELDFSDSGWPGRRGGVEMEIDGQRYTVQDSGNLRGFQCRLVKQSVAHAADDPVAEPQWNVHSESDASLRKRPGLQGPIDDAFCERFVLVLPSRPARHGQVQRWIDREIAYFKQRWARLMRGDVPVVLDRDLTEDQIQTCHLICFGDYSSNRFLFDVSGDLPITWTRESLTVGRQSFDPVDQVPVFCYPNPRNPERYLVVNSGMTYRDFSNTSNSRQIAMLPDWAILNVNSADDSIYAGDIAEQGFFDESWQLPASR